MIKRLVTATLAFVFMLGAMCSTGFTSCSDSHKPDGEGNSDGEGNAIDVKLTEEQWKKAFENLITLDNYTTEQNFSAEAQLGETKNHIEISVEFAYDTNVYCTGHYNEEIVIMRGSSTTSFYSELLQTKDSSVVLTTYGSGFNDVHKVTGNYDEFKSLFFGGQIYSNLKFSSEKAYTATTAVTRPADDSERLQNFYSNFEFKDGRYEADLYLAIADGLVSGWFYSKDKIKVYVTIDPDGYLTNICIKSFEGYVFGGGVYECEMSCSLNFYDYGSTVLDVPEQAIQKIEEYKSENNLS